MTVSNQERIAVALERIADSLGALERYAFPQQQVVTLEPSEYGVQVRAEDLTFEGLSEYAPAETVDADAFVLPDLRTFEMGDVIPEDVHAVADPRGIQLTWQSDTDAQGIKWFGFDYAEDPVGITLPRDTSTGGWIPADFPLTEVLPDDAQSASTYSLSEAAEALSRYGIETGQRRLKQYLKTGIAWTDHYNNPRGCAAEYLQVVKQESPNRDAVVRITAEGLDELARVMGGVRGGA